MSSVALLIILLLAPFIPQCSSRHLRTGANDHLLSEGIEKASFDESTAIVGVLQAKGSRTGKEEEETGTGAFRHRLLLQGSWNHGAGGAVVKDHAGFDVDYVGPRTHSPSHN